MNCIDTQIESALKDINIRKIMNQASKRFKNQLDLDTINTCQLNALWKALINYDETKGAKFTTYLYNGVFIECIKEVKFATKSHKSQAKLHDNIPDGHNPYQLIDILDELKGEEKELFLDRLSNMTIAEISQKYHLNRETARRKVNKMFQNLRKKLS